MNARAGTALCHGTLMLSLSANDRTRFTWLKTEDLDDALLNNQSDCVEKDDKGIVSDLEASRQRKACMALWTELQIV